MTAPKQLQKYESSSVHSKLSQTQKEPMAMKNLISCALLLPLLAILLAGCGPKLGALQSGSLPAMPELPPSARQDKNNPNCSPTCLQVWSKKAEQWQRLLTEQGRRE